MIKRIKQKMGMGFTFLILIAAAFVAFHLLFLDFVVDAWWFESLGYRTYFWQRVLYKYIIFGLSTVIFFLIMFTNFWVASLTLKKITPGGTEPEKRISRIIGRLRRGSLKVYTPLSIVLAFILAYPLYEQWETAMLFFFAPSAGVPDPIFGKDVSFYLFALPLFRLVQLRLFLVSVVVLAATVLLYGIEIQVVRKNIGRYAFPKMAKIHIALLVAFLFLLVFAHLMLKRYELVYVHTHKSFFGPGFVEMNVQLPLLWLSMILLLATFVTLLYFLFTNRGWLITAICSVLFFLSYGAGESNFLTERVQKYFVKPNEISRESKYIAKSIKATLSAYKLNDVTIREYRPVERGKTAILEGMDEVIRNIPIWDKELLLDVYKQLQGLRPYYDFLNVDVDRYHIGNLYQQTFVAARELAVNKLPENAKTWVNLHMKYTHGYGAVITPAIQGGEEPITWFLKDLPPRSEYGVTLKQPGIYFGEGDYTYAIVPNELGEVGYPKGETIVTDNYQGKCGVPLSSVFRKALFALYFKERNIFLTTKTKKDSKILFRRNIVERIKTITPFLLLDRDPYLVVTKGGLFWIQDAYTVSSHYPAAEPFNGEINYIRNSVKIVVDAYNGTVEYYISDPDDPIIRAYSRAYRNIFKPMDAMDPELKKHLRYPRDLFEIQMGIFARYHQTDPETFFKQEDAWKFARIYGGTKEKIIKPYYLTLNLIDPKKFEFLLVQPFSPRGLDTLRAIACVSSDGENYGKITLFAFPKDIQVYGPSQVNALIDQDTYVSQQFTLWDQIGSAVERGKMIILPYSGSVFYIQPVYLKATTRLKIPELKRVIVAFEDMVVMDVNVEGAVTGLMERIKAREEIYRRRIERFSGQEAPGHNQESQ
ncbi:UPF0182 family protein [Thermodesulforhabdus norvegica]|uniref:UPF0182 protein SAMN05660836_00332 n=1 Tax=Thermodesulforhabdus norvegica TaxID=39841 RepID=A0A1I4R0V9_9BACT|nr:UPF0182 family protein [Thermodesulforhabdus norvegica]SFM45887.1 hypothetical protein SAMN05660836_00332 [Thermodesulforhabdus norvegica]